MRRISKSLPGKIFCVSLLCALLFRTASAQVFGSERRESFMVANRQTTVWQFIDMLVNELPFSEPKVAAMLGTALKQSGRDEYRVRWVGEPFLLGDQVQIERMDLVLPVNEEARGMSALSFELSGTCIALEEIRQRYGRMTLVQAPRGHSLQETTVHGVSEPWGQLSFAFKASQPECLYRVTLKPND